MFPLGLISSLPQLAWEKGFEVVVCAPSHKTEALLHLRPDNMDFNQLDKP
jgi:hypothetical protein